MADFDPDQYLASTSPTPTPSFDPDQYLASTQPEQTGEVAPPVIKESVPERPSAVAQEASQASPDLWKSVQDLPEPIRKPVEAAAETASGLIPKNLGEVGALAGSFLPPIQGVQDIGRGAMMLKDVLFGKENLGSIPDVVPKYFPETQVIPEAEKTPPFSKERYKAGFDTLAQIGMAAAVGRGLTPKPNVSTTVPTLTETLGLGEKQPLVEAVNEGLTDLEKYGTQPPDVAPANETHPLGKVEPVAPQEVLGKQEPVAPDLQTGTGEAPKITAAAIQDSETGKIFTGPSHPQIYDKFPQIEGDPGEAFTGEGWNTGGNYIDGFVDQHGKFYDREEAAALHGLTNEASMTELEAVAGKISDKAPYEIKQPSPVSEAPVSTTATPLTQTETSISGNKTPVAQMEAVGTGETTQTVGAASREEYMQRYQALGASKILDGHTELGKFSQEMLKEEPSIPKDDLNEIFNRSKQVVNDLQTAGQSKSQISQFIKNQLSRPQPAPLETIKVRPISALKDQYKAAEKAGTAGFKRGLQQGRDEGNAAASQIRQELAISDKWMAGDQEQVRQNMVDYVNATLPPAERGRFIGAITRALRRPALRSGAAQAGPEGMYRHAFNVMKAIENRAAEVYKSNVIEDIKATLSKSLEAPGIDVAYRRRLKSVADSISGTKPSAPTLSRLQGLQDFVNRERAAGREPNIPQEHLDELKNLTRLPLKKMPINALEKLQEKVNSLASLGRLKAKLMERQWESAKANSVEALSKEPSVPIEQRPLYQPQPTEKLTVGQKFINAVRRTMNLGQSGEKSIAPMDEIYDHLDGARGTYDGFTSQNIKGNLDLAFNEREAELQPIKEQSSQIIKKYGLNKADMETVQAKSIINMIGRERLEAMGVRPDILDKIEKNPLTEGQRAYTDFIRQQYDSVGERVSDIAHRLYQIDMKPVDNYVPLMRDWAANAEREAPTPLADPTTGEVPFNETATMNQIRRDMNPSIVSRTEQGFLKDRIEGAKTAVKLNAEEVFNRHMTDALHFIHGQPVLKMLGEIVRSPEFAAKYGKEGQKIVLDHLDSVANNGFVGHLNRIRVLDWIRNSTSKGAVGFRVASNFVHTSQLPLAAYHAGGPQWWSKGLNLSLTEKGQQFLRRNAAETYVRGGGEPAQAEVEALTGKFGRAGFFVARNIDKLNAQATFMGRYAKEMTERGVPIDQVLDAPVNPEVQSLALRRMHRAVASPQAKDIPQMTSRGKMFGGNVSVARAVNQFRNIFLDNWSNIRHDILRAGSKDAEAVINHLRKGEIAAGAKTVGDAVSHRAAVAAAILSGIAMETGIKLYTKKGIQTGMSAVTGVEPPKVKGQEEKTYLGELQHHMLNRIPFMGQVASAVMYGETGIPTIDAIVSPLKEIGTAVKSRKPETTAKHIVRTTSQVSTLLGIPGSSQAIEAFEPALSKKLGEHIPDRSTKKAANVSRRR